MSFAFRTVFLMVSLMATSAMAQQVGSKATGVYVAAVKEVELSDQIESLGTLRAKQAVAIASTVTELVTEVNFTDGQRVRKGDLLVQLDVTEELALKAGEQARYERAKRQVERFAPLTGRGAASELALDEARGEMNEASARVRATEARIAQRRIVAPFDGVLGLKNINVGTLTQPGTLLTTIDDDAVMLLDFSVPEVFLGTLGIGNKIVASSRVFPGQRYEGVVDGIDSRINPTTRSIVVRAKIPNQEFNLRPGMLMQVVLERSPRRALMVQEEAVKPNGDRAFVLVASDNNGELTAERREVKLGARREGEVEILEGLQSGDLVLTHGSIKVRDGSAITILAEENENETLTELLRKPRAEMQTTESQKAAVSPKLITAG